ncbi:hypothetical protein FS749_011771 [Ceratobasidium sp. UAMH 11750]|nr:hypothetical protein FS749_011771 [Ceratobasidium sp. UAMH 11750]
MEVFYDQFCGALYISAFMIASKVICDDTYSNKSWCVVGQGMFTLHESNQMEREMCGYLEWVLNVKPEDLRDFEAMVRKEYGSASPTPAPVAVPIPRQPAESRKQPTADYDNANPYPSLDSPLTFCTLHLLSRLKNCFPTACGSSGHCLYISVFTNKYQLTTRLAIMAYDCFDAPPFPRQESSRGPSCGNLYLTPGPPHFGYLDDPLGSLSDSSTRHQPIVEPMPFRRGSFGIESTLRTTAPLMSDAAQPFQDLLSTPDRPAPSRQSSLHAAPQPFIPPPPPPPPASMAAQVIDPPL